MNFIESCTRRWRAVAWILLLLSAFMVPGRSEAQDGGGAKPHEVAEAVSKICALPSYSGYETRYEGSLEAGVLIRLVGVRGEGRLSHEEWEGLKDVLERDRASDRRSARECTQNVLPTMLKAFGLTDSSNSLLRREGEAQRNLSMGDPASRAVAFRDAFRSHATFVVELMPANPADAKASDQTTHYEKIINNAIRYYDYDSGVFASRGPPPMGFLHGQISGDTVTFSARSCSGRLLNSAGTWIFTGQVTCGRARYLGKFQMK